MNKQVKKWLLLSFACLSLLYATDMGMLRTALERAGHVCFFDKQYFYGWEYEQNGKYRCEISTAHKTIIGYILIAGIIGFVLISNEKTLKRSGQTTLAIIIAAVMVKSVFLLVFAETENSFLSWLGIMAILVAPLAVFWRSQVYKPELAKIYRIVFYGLLIMGFFTALESSYFGG